MSAAILIERLKAHGVSFEKEPTRAHRSYHGNLSDVFLVDSDFSTTVVARYSGREYVEVGIGTETSCRKLAKMTVYVSEDDNFSGYGDGLWLSASPRKDSWGKDKILFTMET